MKKALLLAIGVIAVSLSLWAEDDVPSSDRSLKFGVRISWDLSSPSTNLYKPASPITSGSGLSAGAFCTLPIADNFYFEPGIGFFYNTMIINYNIAEDLIVGYKLPPAGSLRNAGFKIPLNFGYGFDLTDDIRLSVYTGPQLNVGVSYKQYDNHTKSSINLYDNGYHRVDAQWAFGVRFQYSDNWIAEISGALGMTNTLSGKTFPDTHLRRNTFSIGVGYIF